MTSEVESPPPSDERVERLKPFGNRALRSSIIKRSPREGRSPGRKNVTWGGQGEKRICNVSDCWAHMQTGSEMIKLRGHVRQFRRFFSLDADLSHIRWTPTNKKPHKARISVDSIKEIRVGRNTDMLRASENALCDLQEECLFSIIHGDDYVCVDLVANSADDANIWVTGLMALTQSRHNDQPTSSQWATLRERWLESEYAAADTASQGWLCERATAKLIGTLNPRLAPGRVRNKVKEFGISENEAERGRITMRQFVELYKEIATRPEVYFLMVRYANKDYLSCQDLRLFLETEQGMVGVTTEMCEELIERYEPSEEGRRNCLMTVDGFTAFLQSLDCSIFDPAQQRVSQDMKHPFNRYFIATSHRTFLVEDQQGPCSPDGYVAALRRSCRVVDVEVWDAVGEESCPMVRAGAHAQFALPLHTALAAIHAAAFETSRFPVFLRLAVHCSLEWQKEVVRLLETELGARLYRPSEDAVDWTDSTKPPSPNDFQMKIIILGKRSSAGADDVSEDDEGVASSNRRKGRRIQLLPALEQLTPLWLRLSPLQDLLATAPNSQTMSPRTHVPSLSESTSLRLMHTYPCEFGEMTKDYMVRVWPNATRIDSSNVNPQELWNGGCQMVALNYQTPGLMMDLQEGKFAANGSSGYVLRPRIMSEAMFVPMGGEKLPFAPQILHLRIISGQQLPRPRGSTAKGDSTDPFVVVEVFGLPADCAEERTHTVRNDSDNPAFDESFQFQISVPEVALVRFLVLDDDFIGDDFIGQYTLPFECLQPGYHHIPLRNNEGDPLENATLFVHVAITNRRGGGKAKKRGMSVKRKLQRVQTGIKTIGLKSIDDQFKAVSAAVSEAITLRTDMEAALTDWQDECGLGATGSVRQGIRLIHSRITTLAANATPPASPENSNESPADEELPTFTVDQDENEHPLIVTSGCLPDQLARSFTRLRTLLKQCGLVKAKAEQICEKMNTAAREIAPQQEQLAQLCDETQMKGQKAIRACENFTWNLRLLRLQISLMAKCQDEAVDVIGQVMETATVLDILSERLKYTKQARGRRFSRVVANPETDHFL